MINKDRVYLYGSNPFVRAICPWEIRPWAIYGYFSGTNQGKATKLTSECEWCQSKIVTQSCSLTHSGYAKKYKMAKSQRRFMIFFFYVYIFTINFFTNSSVFTVEFAAKLQSTSD